MMQSRNEGFVD